MSKASKQNNLQKSDGANGRLKLYHAGTLTYTKASLAILFFWLFLGDICYTLDGNVTGPIMLLKFKALDASNTEIGLILGTFPALVYSFLLPVISFKSDRYRSRLGRRIPFMLFSMPFCVLGYLSLAYGDLFGFWLHRHIGFLEKVSANHVVILTFGVLLVVGSFFNTFVSSTFWYLFNDVVPEHMLARFTAWFRTISILTFSLYNFFIFPLSGTHSTGIFIGAALLYLVVFSLMCYNVKEGKYPPPAPYVGGKTGPIAAIMTFGKQTHAFAHYWYLWICTLIGMIGAGGSVIGGGMFALFYLQTVGLNLGQIGSINGCLGVVVAVLTLGAGWLADRFHPIRVVLAGAFIGLAIVTPATMIWLFWHPPPNAMWEWHTQWLQWMPVIHFQQWHFHVTHLEPIFRIQKVYLVIFCIAIGIVAPGMALGGMWDPPMLMRLFPREFYGQFCSVNGVWRSIGGMTGGALTGVFLDVMTHWVGRERAYFYLPVWSFCFGVPSFLLLYMLYKSWKRHGGDDAYVAPVLKESASAIPTNPLL